MKEMVKFKLKQNDSCSFCSQSQDRKHLFHGCVKVREFWKKVENQYEPILGSVPISELEALTGYDPNVSRHTLRNFIILCARKFIYDNNMHGKELDATLLYSVVNNYNKIEYKIADESLKIRTMLHHNKKWKRWSDIIP